jgi:predicted ArsR family transcriptional regulator
MAQRRGKKPPGPRPPSAEERVLRHLCGLTMPQLSATIAKQLGFTKGNLRVVLARLSRNDRVSYDLIDSGRRALWKATNEGREALAQIDRDKAAAAAPAPDAGIVNDGFALFAKARRI